MEPTPDREDEMLAEALEALETRAPYRIESTDHEIVVRIPRSMASEEQIRRYGFNDGPRCASTRQGLWTIVER